MFAPEKALRDGNSNFFEAFHLFALSQESI